MASDKEIRDLFDYIDSIPERPANLQAICREQGYGAVMQEVASAWDLACRMGFQNSHGTPLITRGSNKLVGTCAALATNCGCETEPHCEWCGGGGWLTHHVKKLKDESIIEAALKKRGIE